MTLATRIILLIILIFFSLLHSRAQYVSNAYYTRKYADSAKDTNLDVNRTSPANVQHIYIDSPVLYSGIKNRINITGINTEELYLDNFSRFLETGIKGEYEITPQVPGDIFLSLRNKITKKTAYIFYYNVKRPPTDELSEEPAIWLGAGPAKAITLDELNNQTDIQITPGYKINTATVYFTIPGHQVVYMQLISGSTLKQLEPNIKKCIPGSVITIDNIKVTADVNFRKYLIDGKSFIIQ